MYGTIVCDRPGRLRMRCGRYMFNEEEARGISELLLEVEGVTHALATASNGGIFIEYEGATARDEAFEKILGLDPYDLPVPTHPEVLAKGEAENRLQNQLVIKIGSFFLRKLVLPAPLRIAWTVLRSSTYIIKGFRALVTRGLVVEVLDAASILAAMLQLKFDSAGSVMLLLDASDILGEYVRQRSKAALQDSLLMQVDEVWVVRDGVDVKVTMEEVCVGDLVRVRTGTMIPVDGEVAEGEGEVNESSMTGESRLAHKHEGSTVFAGTALDDGDLVVRVRALPDDSRIAEIVSMIDESENTKSLAQSKAERIADRIVPFNFAAFLAVLAVTRNVTKAASTLMIDYSCAIKLAIPIAVMSAMREGTDFGAVVKGGRYFEELAAADVFIFDKTGTLTNAEPKVTKVLTFGDEYDETEALRLAACLEEHFPHSVARAVVNEAKERGLVHPEEHAKVEYIVAHGIRSTIEDSSLCIGSAHFVFEDEGISMPEGLEELIEREAPGASTIFMAKDADLVAAICITDPPRGNAREIIEKLHDQGAKKIVMLTGDAEAAAKATAEALGIDEYRSQVLPQDKAAIIRSYKEAGHTVAMVGDGVNDSPGLAEADVAIAMGDATDIAQEVADIVLLGASLEKLPVAQMLAKRLMGRIERTYRSIVVFNTAIMGLGVLGVIPPTTGALLHNVSTTAFSIANTRSLLAAGDKEVPEVE